MIKSFKDKDAQKFYEGFFVKKFDPIQKQLKRKLKLLKYAEKLKDLRSPPGNQLEF